MDGWGSSDEGFGPRGGFGGFGGGADFASFSVDVKSRPVNGVPEELCSWGCGGAGGGGGGLMFENLPEVDGEEALVGRSFTEV